MIDVYFSFGSNQGDRRQNIESAATMLFEELDARQMLFSDIIETPAWGFDGEEFLNCAVLCTLPRKNISAEAQALEILKVIKRIEKTLGRTETIEYDAEGNRIYHSRPIDIDILFFGQHVIDLPTLTIPHPLIGERDFVKIPLSQIAKPALKRAFSALF